MRNPDPASRPNTSAWRASGRLRFLASIVFAGLACLTIPALAGAEPADVALAAKYSPVMRLVEQREPCGPGEPFEPLDIDVLLRDEGVALRGPWKETGVLMVKPSANDLSTGKYEYHLDFPGDALEPGCDYEKWAKRLTDSAPTTYARVVQEPARPRKLALQYWFFYPFNDYNNKHEGDWEMVQLVFEATSSRQALAREPVSIGFSQHSGAEAATWGDDKLEVIDGSHPVVYPAAGSHANYFEPALYLGRSAAEGVGCDNTNGPSRDLRPRVEFVPTNQADYEKEYPWLAFQGRWGERQPAFYNGPTGPNTKRQWTEPISWAESKFREKSFAVPAGGLAGSDATDFFCEVVAAGSNALTRVTRNGPALLVILGALVVLALWAASRTHWRPSAPRRLGRRRAWGQIVTAAWRMYRMRFRVFALIGALFIPVGVAITIVQALLLRFADLIWPAATEGEANGFAVAVGLGFGVFLTIFALTVVQAATARAMFEIDEERPVSATSAYRATIGNLRTLFFAVLLASVVVLVLEFFVIGIPIAVWLLVRWSLLAQVVSVDDRGARDGLRRSGDLVRGHWLRVASITLVVTSAALLLGPLFGTLLLFVSSVSLTVVNLIAGVVYAIVMPFVAIATTYLYYDLRVRAEVTSVDAEDTDILPAELA